MSRTAEDAQCGNRVEYKNLESRMFDTYYRLSVSENIIEELYGKGEYLDLCRFTRNAYAQFTKKPDLLSKTLNEDDAHLYWFNATAYGKPKLKVNMRKALKMVSDFMQFIWNVTTQSKKNENIIIINESIKIPTKYKTLLHEVGILLKNNTLSSSEYPKMFDAMILLSSHVNGFERFIRCVYDDYSSYKSIFGHIIGDTELFNRFIDEIEKKGYKYKVNLNSGGVKSFESVCVYWTKNINGNDAPSNLSMYDRTNYGIHINFNGLLKDQLLIFLLVQDVRKVLELFDSLDEKLCAFIIEKHARCNNCGYCTQRNKNRTSAIKPYTVSIEYKDEKYALCPINYVYTYCWNYIDESLVDGIAAYLKLQEKIHNNV